MCENEEDEWEWIGYESGPFCVHWDDFGECIELCVCGHVCGAHDLYGGCDECQCEQFEDKEDGV